MMRSSLLGLDQLITIRRQETPRTTLYFMHAFVPPFLQSCHSSIDRSFIINHIFGPNQTEPGPGQYPKAVEFLYSYERRAPAFSMAKSKRPGLSKTDRGNRAGPG